jgi:hypothetical protein
MEQQTIEEGRRMPRRSKDAGTAKPSRTPPPAEDEWDRVDQESWESFPASDPPSHWAGRDIAPDPR